MSFKIFFHRFGSVFLDDFTIFFQETSKNLLALFQKYPLYTMQCIEKQGK